MQQQLFGDVPMQRNAIISKCGQYRWWLDRLWNADKQKIMWVMLNPSTADADIDDPTIRRCINYSKAWGFGSLCVLNLFAYRATDPAELKRVENPVGVSCDGYICDWAQATEVAIAAWGNHGSLYDRDHWVTSLLQECGCQVECLGTTKSGQPKHPLYLPLDARRYPYKGKTDA